jgi:hypothetical protein
VAAMIEMELRSRALKLRRIAEEALKELER